MIPEGLVSVQDKSIMSKDTTSAEFEEAVPTRLITNQQYS